MKLKPIHLFVILFLSLTFCCGLTFKLREGLESTPQTTTVSQPPSSSTTTSAAASTSVTPSTTASSIPAPTNTSTTSPATTASQVNTTQPGAKQVSPTNSATGTPSSPPVNASIIDTSTNENLLNMPTYVNVNGITYFRPEYYPSNSYANGVEKDKIPNGENNNYLLKTQIVPPVCPATPPIILYSNKNENDNANDNNKKNDHTFYNPYKYYSTMLPNNQPPQPTQNINKQNVMLPIQQNNTSQNYNNNINNVNKELSERNYNYEMYNRLYRPVETSEPLPMLNDFSAFA